MEEKYSGYLCIKCKSIPLFQIIPEKTNIKIFSSCKCYKQIHNIDSFIKHKYHKNIIDLSKIPKDLNCDKQEENDININSIIDKLNKTKEKINKEVIEIKDKVIKILQNKIDEINALYKNYTINNNKIIFIIEEIIKSYQLIKDNQSIIFNLLNNINFNDNDQNLSFLNNSYIDFNALIKETEKYYTSKYIISTTPIKIKEKIILKNYYPIKTLIEMDNNICAYCLSSIDEPNILLYDMNLNNMNVYSFKAHDINVGWIIKSNTNNIISAGSDGIIKIWPKINQDFLSENKDIIKSQTNIYNINLEPIYEYKSEIKDMSNIKKMINLKDNQFFVASKEYIFLFRYIINQNKNNTKIELITSSHKFFLFSLTDVFVLEREKDEIIGISNNFTINLINIPYFETISSFNVNYMIENSLIQVNYKEILIYDNGDNCLKYLDINNYKTKLIIKSISKSKCLLNMGDGTIIQSTFQGLERYLIKNLEKVPRLISFGIDKSNFNETSYYNYDYINREFIVYMNKLKDGKIILSYNDGIIEIYNNLKYV